MSEHTPGPWKVFRGSRHQSDRNYMAVIDSIPDVDGKVVANCICHIASTNENAEANVKLIAAAPELADALRELHDFAIVGTHFRYCDRSAEAFLKAGKLLRRIGK